MNALKKMARGPKFWLVLPLILCIIAMVVLRLSMGRSPRETPERTAVEEPTEGRTNPKEKSGKFSTDTPERREGPKADVPAAASELAKLVVNVKDDAGRPLPGLQVRWSMSKGRIHREGRPFEHRLRERGGGVVSVWTVSGVFQTKEPVITDHEGRAMILMNPQCLKGRPAVITLRVEGEGVVEDAFAKHLLNMPPAGTLHETTIVPRLGRRLRGRLVNMAPEDREDMWVYMDEVSDEAQSGWYHRPKPGKDGSFTTPPPVPLAPLVLEVSHVSDKYLPVRQEIDPRQTTEIVVVLQPNPNYRRGQYLEIEFVPPHPNVGWVTLRVTPFRKEDWRDLTEVTGTIDFSRLHRRGLPPGNYRVMAVSIGNAGLYGEADASLQPETDTRVTVHLRKSARVIVAPRDHRTGQAFPYHRTRSMVFWSPDGTVYPWRTEAWTPEEVYERTGEMTADVPPGRLRIDVEDSKEQYAPATTIMNLSSGEVGRFAPVLVPR
jgi:hypothetical protein